MKSLLSYLEKRLAWLAIPHLTVLLVLGQAICWILAQADPTFIEGLLLDPEKIMAGQVWRLTTFLFIPPTAHPVFILFAFYIFWMMGEALEHAWGNFRFTMYMLIGYLATLAAGFLITRGATTNHYMMGSVFLAFAFLYPDFEFYLFFLLPVKVKWLALITWIFYGWILLFGTWADRLLIITACLNYFIFFGAAILRRGRAAHRRQRFEAKASAQKAKALHTCTTCGITEKTAPDMEFRVCSQCADGSEYCEKHQRAHEHK